MNGSLVERVHAALTELGLSQADALLESHLERAANQQQSYADFLLGLLGSEQEFRKGRALATRLRMANLPYAKTLSDFDLGFQPSIDARLVRELQTLRFVSDASNVILLGPPGVGKTHLAVGLSRCALEAGMSVYFVTAHDLICDLGKAARDGNLDRRMRLYEKPKVLVIDEVGYLPLDPVGATLLFQLVSARYERGSIVLTSNKSYTDWGQVFGETTLAAAILDRLLHHSTTLNIRGESYRLKERKKAGLLGDKRPAGPALAPAGAGKRHVTHGEDDNAPGA